LRHPFTNSLVFKQTFDGQVAFSGLAAISVDMFHKRLLFAGKDQFLASPVCGLTAIMETPKLEILGHFSCSEVSFKIEIMRLVIEIKNIN
jgi:hypothetical protein